LIPLACVVTCAAVYLLGPPPFRGVRVGSERITTLDELETYLAGYLTENETTLTEAQAILAIDDFRGLSCHGNEASNEAIVCLSANFSFVWVATDNPTERWGMYLACGWNMAAILNFENDVLTEMTTDLFDRCV
ncbi:MAG: hypothetical protein AAGK74_14095, partial [Chloroflexota bacterium]